MSGRLKKALWLLPIPILLLGLTTVPSGGWRMYNAARQVVIEFFDTGDATFDGDVTANAFIGDGSGLTGVSGGTGHTVKEEGTPLTARAGLNFIGPTVTATDNAGTSSTDVTINAVAGPSSSVDNTVPRFDSTTGKLIQSSGVTIDDSNNLGGIAALTANNLDLTTVLAVTEGGTGAGTFTDAGVIIGNGSGVLQATGAGTAGQVLTSNGTGVDPTFQSFPGGGDALTTQPLSQFAATTSSQLLGVLSNETGSGLAVFNISPTFTTPNLGTPSNLVLTNATGLPVAGGGTGATTFTDAGVLIGNSTGAIQSTGAGTAGQVLTSNGAGVDPTFQSLPGGGGTGDLVGPASATDNAIARYDGTTGKLVQNSAVTIADTTGNITTSGTVDGRDLSTDGTKLDGIETGATADQTDAEIETAYNNQVAIMSQAEAEAGVSTTAKRVTPQRISQAIAALAPGPDLTYGSNAGASDSAVYVDVDNEFGIGTTAPDAMLHLYSGSSMPRALFQYYNPAVNDVTQYPATITGTTPGTSPTWVNPTNAGADDAADAFIGKIGSGSADGQTLKLTNLSFAISGTAVITGVEVDVEGLMGGLTAELHAYLVRAGTIDTGVDRATGATWSNTNSVHTYGGPADDWGGITVSEVNNSGFGFAFQPTFTGIGQLYIDYVRITVYYTDGGGDYVWSTGVDTLDGAWTIRGNAVDLFRVAYAGGDTTFAGVVDADGYKQDGVLYDLSTFSTGSGDLVGPASATDNAIARFDSTTGKLVQNSEVLIGDTGNITMGSLDTIDGRDVSVDGTKLDGITAGASVSSVAASGTDGIDIDSGSPVTTSGTITLGINATNLFAHLMSSAATVTPVAADSLLISDASDSGNVKDVLVSNFMLALSGSDNAIYKKDGTTGQAEASGITIDDSNNISGAGTINGHSIIAGSGAFLTTDGAQTVTNKDIQPRETVVNTSVTVDAGLYDRVVLTGTSSSPLSIGAPTGTFANGKKLEFAINQHGSSAFTLNWNAVFKAATEWGTVSNAIPAVSTTLDAWDYYLFEWNDYEDEWHLIGLSQGN